MVGFQFHFNRLNDVEKIVDEKNDHIHTHITVVSIIARYATSHKKRLQHHVNEEASKLLNVQKLTRRLKRKKPFELAEN